MPKKSKSNYNPVLIAGLYEGLFAVNASMASRNPHLYGSIIALLAPVASTDAGNEVTFWVGLVAAELLAIYNINLDRNKYSEPEAFRKNMIGWNLLASVISLSAWLTDNAGKDDKVSLAFMPTSNGGEFGFGYRY